MLELNDMAPEIATYLNDARKLAEKLAVVSDTHREDFLRCFDNAGWDPAAMKRVIIAHADVPGDQSVGACLSFDPYYGEGGSQC